MSVGADNCKRRCGRLPQLRLNAGQIALLALLAALQYGTPAGVGEDRSVHEDLEYRRDLNDEPTVPSSPHAQVPIPLVENAIFIVHISVVKDPTCRDVFHIDSDRHCS